MYSCAVDGQELPVNSDRVCSKCRKRFCRKHINAHDCRVVVQKSTHHYCGGLIANGVCTQCGPKEPHRMTNRRRRTTKRAATHPR